MDEIQISILNYHINLILDDLRILKQDNSIENFNTYLDEIRERTIINLENFFLLPTNSFIPVTRTFREDDFSIREEISTEVNKRFVEFQNENNN